jgi:hypothetical protein
MCIFMLGVDLRSLWLISRYGSSTGLGGSQSWSGPSAHPEFFLGGGGGGLILRVYIICLILKIML